MQEIAWQGENELKACQTILRGFAEYLRSRPDPIGELGDMVSDRPTTGLESAQFAPGAPAAALRQVLPARRVSPASGPGAAAPAPGVKVAVIDSGIDADHPAVGGGVSGYVGDQ